MHSILKKKMKTEFIHNKCAVFKKLLFEKNIYNNFLNKIKIFLKKNRNNETIFSFFHGIIAANELTVRDIMIPRIDVFCIPNLCSVHELIEYAYTSAYSRIPVYENSIDNIIGILHIREIFTLFKEHKNKKKQIDIQNVLTEPLFVPESKKLFTILKNFQENSSHLAVIVDEYGGFAGIITMEDVLEEIIGDVQDEYDMVKEDIKEIEEKVYSVDARTPLEKFNEYFKTNISDQEIDTIGGFLISLVGNIPKINQNMEYENFSFKILSKKKNSLMRIRVMVRDV